VIGYLTHPFRRDALLGGAIQRSRPNRYVWCMTWALFGLEHVLFECANIVKLLWDKRRPFD